MVARLRDAILRGTRASQPAATAVDIGTLYAVSDEGGILERSDGTVWQSVGGIATAPDNSLQTGTSFPGSPSTGDRYRRSDLGYLVFFYDGTRWLSEQVFATDWTLNSNADYDSTARYAMPWASDDVYLMTLVAKVIVNGTNDGSNYWTMAINALNGGGVVATVNTSAESASTYVTITDTVGAVVSAGRHQFSLDDTKTGSPATLLGGLRLNYRRIAS